MDVDYRGEVVTSGGHGFIGIGRKRLLEILQDRARSLGAVLHFAAECDPADAKWQGYDLVIAADGINSRFRDASPEAFRVDVDMRPNKFVWLGTSKAFDAFTFAFEETEHGWIWAHAYRFARLLDLHRRMFGRHLAALRVRSDGRGGEYRRLREAVRQVSRWPPAAIECLAPRRPGGLAQFPPHQVRPMGERERRPARRCGAHRPFLDARAPAGARGRDQWPRCDRPGCPSGGARRISGGAQSRCSAPESARNSTEWFETRRATPIRDLQLLIPFDRSSESA